MFECDGLSASPRPQAGQAILVALPDSIGRHSLFKRDAALFWEGDPVDSYYRVIDGAVRLYKQMPDGRRQVSDFYGAGDLIVPEFAPSHAFTAEAIVDSVVCRYSRLAVDRLVLSDPRLASDLLALAFGRLASAHGQMVVLGRKTAGERIASFLVERSRQRPGRDHVINLPMSRTDIGDYLGLTIESVSRGLSKLRRDGVIDLPDAHSVRVVDFETLEHLSAGEA